jgi:hypothetical protein
LVDEVERCPKCKAFLSGTTILSRWQNAWLKALATVRIQRHTPLVATREVAEAAKTSRNFSESCKVLIK